MTAKEAVQATLNARTEHRAWEDGFITRYGRKFTLSLMAIITGFVINVLAMVAMSAVSVEMAREYGSLVSEYTDVLIVGIACFTGADALVTWKTASVAGAGGAMPDEPTRRKSGAMKTQVG